MVYGVKVSWRWTLTNGSDVTDQALADPSEYVQVVQPERNVLPVAVHRHTRLGGAPRQVVIERAIVHSVGWRGRWRRGRHWLVQLVTIVTYRETGNVRCPRSPWQPTNRKVRIQVRTDADFKLHGAIGRRYHGCFQETREQLEFSAPQVRLQNNIRTVRWRIGLGIFETDFYPHHYLTWHCYSTRHSDRFAGHKLL